MTYNSYTGIRHLIVGLHIWRDRCFFSHNSPPPNKDTVIAGDMDMEALQKNLQVFLQKKTKKLSISKSRGTRKNCKFFSPTFPSKRDLENNKQLLINEELYEPINYFKGNLLQKHLSEFSPSHNILPKRAERMCFFFYGKKVKPHSIDEHFIRLATEITNTEEG